MSWVRNLSIPVAATNIVVSSEHKRHKWRLLDLVVTRFPFLCTRGRSNPADLYIGTDLNSEAHGANETLQKCVIKLMSKNCGIIAPLDTEHDLRAQSLTVMGGGGSRIFEFFFFERPNLFAICNNTFSKWWVGWRMACRRILSSTPLLVRGSETGEDSGE
jgi:hypothetical protein